MNFKIIETSTLLPDVLLYRDRNENGQETVNILSIGKIGNEEDSDMFVIESVTFETAEAAKCFISDFTQMSAEIFCNRNEVTYS